MPTLTLKSSYKIDSSQVLSASELKEIYLFGIPVKDREGNLIPDSTFDYYIQSCTEQVENYLSLLFKKQVYTETLSFSAEDYWNWGYLRTTYPIVTPFLLEGFLNTTKQVSYPKEWLTAKRSNDGVLYHRNLYIVPAGNSTSLTQAQLFTGLIPNLTYLGLARIPDYWTANYVTGFNKVPKNLIDIIGKLSAINIFRIAGDLILAPGISSFSLSIDGLSQSQSAKAYDARITAMLSDLTQRLLPQAKDYYKGIMFGVA